MNGVAVLWKPLYTVAEALVFFENEKKSALSTHSKYLANCAASGAMHETVTQEIELTHEIINQPVISLCEEEKLRNQSENKESES